MALALFRTRGWMGAGLDTEDSPLPPLLRPQAAMSQVVRNLGGLTWGSLYLHEQAVWGQRVFKIMTAPLPAPGPQFTYL